MLGNPKDSQYNGQVSFPHPWETITFKQGLIWEKAENSPKLITRVDNNNPLVNCNPTQAHTQNSKSGTVHDPKNNNILNFKAAEWSYRSPEASTNRTSILFEAVQPIESPRSPYQQIHWEFDKKIV